MSFQPLWIVPYITQSSFPPWLLGSHLIARSSTIRDRHNMTFNLTITKSESYPIYSHFNYKIMAEILPISVNPVKSLINYKTWSTEWRFQLFKMCVQSFLEKELHYILWYKHLRKKYNNLELLNIRILSEKHSHAVYKIYFTLCTI